LCQEHLESWHRAALKINGLSLSTWMRDSILKTEERFDVIISDVPEPVEAGPAMKLFTRQYFELLKSKLSPNGMFALQAGDYGLPFIEMHSAIHNTISQVMPFCRSYRSFIPSFNTEWGFNVAAPQA
jgi:spermidine synthase